MTHINWGNMRRILLVICGCITAGTSATAQSLRSDTWQSLSEESRVAFVVGFRDAVATYRGVLNASIRSDPKFATSLSPAQKSDIIALSDQVFDGSDADQVGGPSAVSRVMTEFYKDPANSNILFGDMVAVAVARLRGVSDDDIKRALEVRRKLALPKKSL
jgi:hypothetical protein